MIDDITFKKKVIVEIKVLVANDIVFATKATSEETIFPTNALMAETTLVTKVLMAPITAQRAFLRAVATATMYPATEDITFKKKVKIATGIFSKEFPTVTTVFLAADIVFATNVKIAWTMARKARRIEAVTKERILEKNFNMETGILSRPLIKEVILKTMARDFIVSQEGPFLIVSFLVENFGIKILTTSAD